MTSSPLLIANDIEVRYTGGGVGVSGVNLAVAPGKVVGLLGPNGAGKSSTLTALGGYLKRDVAYLSSGSIRFRGEDISRWGPVERAKRGIALVPEREKVFSDLTVLENLKLARVLVSQRDFLTQLDLAFEIFPDLKNHISRKGGLLSGGQRQMLAIAGAICAKPQLVLVDELTLGLAPALIQSMSKSLRVLADEGMAIVMAEQNVSVGLELAEEILVLDGGAVVAAGTPSELRAEERIMSTYLGGH